MIPVNNFGCSLQHSENIASHDEVISLLLTMGISR